MSDESDKAIHAEDVWVNGMAAQEAAAVIDAVARSCRANGVASCEVSVGYDWRVSLTMRDDVPALETADTMPPPRPVQHTEDDAARVREAHDARVMRAVPRRGGSDR